MNHESTFDQYNVMVEVIFSGSFQVVCSAGPLEDTLHKVAFSYSLTRAQRPFSYVNVLLCLLMIILSIRPTLQLKMIYTGSIVLI